MFNALEAECLAAGIAPFVGDRGAWIGTYVAVASRSARPLDPAEIARLASAAWRHCSRAHPAVIAGIDYDFEPRTGG